MVNDKSYSVEKEVLFGDFRKFKTLTKKQFINGLILNVIFFVIFGTFTLFVTLSTMNYVDFGGNIFFDIEKVIILLLLIISILIGVIFPIRNIILTNKNVPIPIIQEQSTAIPVIALSMLVFIIDMCDVDALKRLDIFIPELNLILLLSLGILFFVIGMMVEKNRINKLKIDNSRIATVTTISSMAGITFAMYGYIKFTATYIGYEHLMVILGFLTQSLFLVLGKVVMLRIERKKFLDRHNLDLIDVRNEMLGINQNEENISY